jgi:hypothetical protein
MCPIHDHFAGENDDFWQWIRQWMERGILFSDTPKREMLDMKKG